MSEETVSYWQPMAPSDIVTTTERTTDTNPLYPDRDGASFECSSEQWTVEVTHKYQSPTMSPIDHAVIMEQLSPDASYADFEDALRDELTGEDIYPHAPETVRVQLKYVYRPATNREGITGYLGIYKWGTREYSWGGNTNTTTEWVPYYDEEDRYREEVPVRGETIVERFLNDEHEWETKPDELWGEVPLRAFPYAHALGDVPYSKTPQQLIRDAVREEHGEADAELRELITEPFDPATYRRDQRSNEDNTDSTAHADD